MTNPLFFLYNDSPVTLLPVTDVSFAYCCPRCRGWNELQTRRHRLVFYESGELRTIVGSILCPRGCGWHVFVANGVAEPA